MPYARRDGVRLYYEVEGQGPPLLLLEGLGYGLWMWYRQRPALRRHFTLVLPDHRGVGRSDKPDEPYTIGLLAEDAVAVLDHAGVPRAHVLGVSMGGMVALELALRHPDRVDRLVLVSTSPGGPQAEPMPQATLDALLAARALPGREGLRAAMALAFGPGFPEAHPEEVERILDWRLEEPQPAYAWARQFQAAASFDVSGRLDEVSHPTLVVVGSADRVLPPSNSALLARRLRAAQVHVFHGAGHLVFLERAQEFNALVVGFLTAAGTASESEGAPPTAGRPVREQHHGRGE